MWPCAYSAFCTSAQVKEEVMSTDWRRLQVDAEAARRLEVFLDADKDAFAAVRADVLAALGCWQPAAHTYAGEGGMCLVQYERMPPEELLVSVSGRLATLAELREKASTIIIELDYGAAGWEETETPVALPGAGGV